MGEGGRLYPLDLRMFRQACDLQQTADALLLTCHFTLSYQSGVIFIESAHLGIYP